MLEAGRGPFVVAAVLSGAMLVSGCSGSGTGPTTLPPLSASPSVTPSPSTTVSDIDAATAVVRRYYALLNELRVDMDATSLAALMTPTCPCREQIRAIQNASRRGQHYIDQVHLVSVTPGRDSPIQVTVLVEYNADAGGLVDAHGHFVTHSPPTRGVRRLFEVRRLTTGAWRIAEIDAL